MEHDDIIGLEQVILIGQVLISESHFLSCSHRKQEKSIVLGYWLSNELKCFLLSFSTLYKFVCMCIDTLLLFRKIVVHKELAEILWPTESLCSIAA